SDIPKMREICWSIAVLLLVIRPVSAEVIEGMHCAAFREMCFMDMCPEGEMCLRNGAETTCCGFNDLLLPEVPTTSTEAPTTTVATSTTTEACFDLSARCVLQKHLCDLSDYDKITDVYCQKTCARPCGAFTMAPNSTACVDVTPDCIGKEALCTMPEYATTMKKYCSKSCTFCT
ncbi:hypothetical protein PFISCL1PPCAC_12953, partial [Pristionchus fissidentatus]